MVANLYFAIEVELKVLPIFPSITWSRYHDDIVAVCPSRQVNLSLNRCIRSACKSFKVVTPTVFSVGKIGFHLYLELKLTSCALEVCRSLLKIPCPLSPLSAHPWFVHLSWPGALVHSICQLCNHGTLHRSLCKLYENYALGGAHSITLMQFAKAIGQHVEGHTASKRKSPTAGVKPKDIPIVLGYSSVFKIAFSRALASAPFPIADYRIVPAWRNVLPTVESKVKMVNSLAIKRNNVREEGGFVAAVVTHNRNSSVRGSHDTNLLCSQNICTLKSLRLSALLA